MREIKGAGQRRDEILLILNIRRRTTMYELAQELGVTDRTIRSDVSALMTEYPVETVRGNGGGVALAEWYKPKKHLFTRKYVDTLVRQLEIANDHDANVIREMLDAFS